MIIPDDLYYTRDHEWAKKEGDDIKVGITDYAQDSLGDIVFISLPEVGKEYQAGDTLGEVESTKSVSEIYSPISGVVKAVNSDLEYRPEKINEDPYNEGWICVISPKDHSELKELLSAEEYRSLVES
jgi:glycine cleavage system H protein